MYFVYYINIPERAWWIYVGPFMEVHMNDVSHCAPYKKGRLCTRVYVCESVCWFFSSPCWKDVNVSVSIHNNVDILFRFSFPFLDLWLEFPCEVHLSVLPFVVMMLRFSMWLCDWVSQWVFCLYMNMRFILLFYFLFSMFIFWFLLLTCTSPFQNYSVAIAQSVPHRPSFYLFICIFFGVLFTCCVFFMLLLWVSHTKWKREKKAEHTVDHSQYVEHYLYSLPVGMPA